MIVEFAILGDLGPINDRSLIGPLGENALGGTGSTRFNLKDISFFDLFYNSKSVDIALVIEYIGKSTFFWDIYIFIDYIKDIARIKGEELVR